MAKKPEPPKPATWDVYKIAKKAAQEFRTGVWRPYAVGRQ
jgi:hypothetical protein